MAMRNKSGFLIFFIFLSARLSGAEVPPSLNIQGRLTDHNEVNREGNFTFVFTIYDAAVGGKSLWRKTYTGVQVRNGSFQVSVGNPDGKDDSSRNLASVFDGESRWVGIRVEGEDGKLDPEMVPRQQLVTVPHAFVSNRADHAKSADRLTTPAVPIGTILDWYRPAPNDPVPEGFQICDGSAITDPLSPMRGQNTPNLIDKFTYGVNIARLGETGGSVHAGNPNVDLAHGHSYRDVPLHNHPIHDPGHSHNVIGANGAPGGIHIYVPGAGNERRGDISREQTGITVNAAGVQNPATDSALSSVSVMPKYFGVLKIILIK